VKGPKPTRCPFDRCPVRAHASKTSDLREHILAMHVDRFTPFKCPACAYNENHSTSTRLSRHLRDVHGMSPDERSAVVRPQEDALRARFSAAAPIVTASPQIESIQDTFYASSTADEAPFFLDMEACEATIDNPMSSFPTRMFPQHPVAQLTGVGDSVKPLSGKEGTRLTIALSSASAFPAGVPEGFELAIPIDVSSVHPPVNFTDHAILDRHRGCLNLTFPERDELLPHICVTLTLAVRGASHVALEFIWLSSAAHEAFVYLQRLGLSRFEWDSLPGDLQKKIGALSAEDRDRLDRVYTIHGL
jgi:hypothetical protein